MYTTVNSMCTKPIGLILSKCPPATNEDQHKASTTQQVGSECTHEQQAGSKRAPAQHMRINRKQGKYNKQAACAHMSKKQGSTSKTANKEQATSQRTHTRMWGLRNETQSWTKNRKWAKPIGLRLSKCTPVQQMRINIKQEQHNKQGASVHKSNTQGANARLHNK